MHAINNNNRNNTYKSKKTVEAKRSDGYNVIPLLHFFTWKISERKQVKERTR